jgi:hypothetical protein
MRSRWGVSAIAVAIAVVLGSYASTAWANDSYEPNNSVYTAVGPQMAGASLTSWLSSSNDQDWFWFYVDRSTTVHILLQEPADVFYELRLSGPGTDNWSIASDNNCDYWNWLPSAQIDYTVPKAGYYYITVDPYLGSMGGYSADNPYVLSLSGDYITKPPPSVGKPKAPAKMSRKRTYTVYGYLKPRHDAGTVPVLVYKYKKVSGKWKNYGYVSATASNYASFTKYSCPVRLSSPGKWRLRARAPEDSVHSAAWSAYTYVTVK